MAAEEASVSSPGGKRRKVVAPRVALAAALPDEMVTEVLLRLPVKSVLRFRAVSRAWAALLSSEDFCGLHKPPPPLLPKLLFVSPAANFASTAVYSCSPSSSRGDHEHGHGHGELLLTLPDARGNSVDVAPAPCRGLTLLHDALAPAYYVCNAATRAVTRLPPPCQEDAPHAATAGLGFDVLAREHKVVRLFQSGLLGDAEAAHVACEVYTLGGGDGDRWRPPARGVPFRFCKLARSAIWHAANWKVPPVFVGGFLHWLIDPEFFDKKPRAAILSFSLTSETFGWVRSPPFSVSGAHLVELDGHLCVVRDLRWGSWPSMLHIWKLEDFSSGEWSLSHRIELPRAGDFLERKAVRVIGSFGGSKPGEKIIIATSRHEIFTYDTMSSSLEAIHSSTMETETHPQVEPYDVRFSLFEETLVPVYRTKEEIALSSPMAKATKEILLRLPAKSVLNFKFVCQQWHSLIRSDSFSQAYFLHKNMDRRPKIMLVSKLFGGEGFSFIPVDKWLPQPADQVELLDTKFVCSKPCHGLNLVSTVQRDYLYNPCLGFQMMYINLGPMLNHDLELYANPVEPDGHPFTIDNKNVALGFDPSMQEHVIVEMFYHMKDYQSRQYYLSCSVTDCDSRDVRQLAPPPLPVNDMPSAYLEGMLYWMSEPRLGQSHERAIVSFNIATRMFDVIPCPSRIARSWDNQSPRRAFVAELEGVLYAVLANQVRDELCLWKWEHGQWDRSYTIYLKSCLDYSLRTNIVVPWGIDPTDGRILLSTGRRLGFYDPLKQEVENYIALDQVPILKRKKQTWCPGDGDQMPPDQPSSSSTSSGKDLSHSIDQSEELNGMSCNLWPPVPMLYEESLAYYRTPGRARILQDLPI
ncbi:unnamed protein product [Urochloa humidicola]